MARPNRFTPPPVEKPLNRPKRPIGLPPTPQKTYQMPKPMGRPATPPNTIIGNRINKVNPSQELVHTDTVSSNFRGYDNEKFPYIAEVLCKNYGCMNRELAVIFGVVEKTIESWVTKYPDFKKAIKAGKDEFDTVRVESALLKRSLGYDYEEVTIKTTTVKAKHKYDDYEIKIPAIETSRTTKHLPSDVKAIMFWLSNRSSNRWKMVMTVNAQIKSETVQKKITATGADIKGMTSEQLRTLKELIGSQKQGQACIELNPMQSEEDMTMQVLAMAENLYTVESERLEEANEGQR